MPISVLQSPSPDYQVREVKEWYIDYLADMLSKEDDDHEDLTAPLLVVASVNATDFQERKKDSYTYQVLSTIYMHREVK